MSAYDIMKKFVVMIEKERIRKDMTQKELYQASGISASAYRAFMDTKNTKFENIVNLLFTLGLSSKLEALISVEKFVSLEEIRDEKKKKVKQRVRKAKNG